MTDAAMLETVRRITDLRLRIAEREYPSPADLAERLDPRFRRPAHIDLLSRAVADAVADGGRLIVSMPPRAGKSMLTSVWAPVWFLTRHPDRSVILASHESNFAVSWGRRARGLYRSVSHAGVGSSSVSEEVSAAGEWETSAGGGMLARGIGAGITGRGAHLLLVDDPIKDFLAAHSKTVRDAQWEWWLSTALTRLEPGAAVVVTMTRWHEDDLAGRIMSSEWDGDPDRWRVLRIPAIAEDDDLLGREPGEPMTIASLPETADEAAARWAEIRDSVGSYVWQGLYQQRPSEPEGALLRRAWWQRFSVDGDTLRMPGRDPLPIDELRVIQSWDLAVKDTGDYTCGQVWGEHGPDRFLLDQVRERLDFVAAKRAMLDMARRWPSTERTVIEDAANGPAIIADLRRELSGLKPWTPKGSKTARVLAVQGDVESGHVWLPERAAWDVQALVDECAEFPRGAHDDQVDALSQALTFIRGVGAAVRMHVPSQRTAPPSLPQSRRRIAR